MARGALAMKFRPLSQWFRGVVLWHGLKWLDWGFGIYMVPTMPEGVTVAMLLGPLTLRGSCVFGDWE